MDEVEKKWRNFLLEGRKVPYQIYCDMDGVLVDLEEGVIETLGLEDIDEDIRSAAVQIIKSGLVWQDVAKENIPELNKGVKEIFRIISKNKNFWANLPLKDDAQQLWGFLSSLNPEPYILSAPWDEESRRGKVLWLSGIAGNLDPTPPKGKIILTHDKHMHAINPATKKPNILIDDMDKYLMPWKRAGGIAIRHISTANTTEELKKWLD